MATVLVAILLDTYGTDFLQWEPIVLWQELYEDFNAKLPELNCNKIQALALTITSDQPFNDWLVFNNTCEALNDDPVNPDVLDIATPEQMAWAVMEMALNSDAEDQQQFSTDVRTFMGVVLAGNGILTLPKSLTMAILPDYASDQSMISEDPILYSGFVTTQEENRHFINKYLEDQFDRLMTQLSMVTLDHRDESSWNDFAKKVADKLAKAS